jgi:3-oxoadipate enol-lactonase
MFAEANGIRIRYELDGREGAPWVSFVTGIANDVTLWDGQVPALADGFRILRMDSPGAWRLKSQDR